MIGQFIQKTLSKMAYAVQKTQGIGFNPAYLSKICKPRTVIDVGVGFGTFPLYEAFPHAKFILIEPLKEYKDSIDSIAKRYDCEIYYKAVGDKSGYQEININKSNFHKSSFLSRTSLTRDRYPLIRKMVEVTTLDFIYQQSPAMERPILLKIDTEGYELSALQGAKILLRATDVVILEASIAKRFEDGYEFEDLILFMKQNGFYVFSFLTLNSPKGEVRQRFADIVFKQRKNETR